MFGALLNFSEIIPLLTFIFGSFAGYRAGQLFYRRNHVKLRRSIRTTLVLLALAVVGVLGLVILSGLLISFGWDFASNRFVVALPPMAIAVVAAFVTSVPRLLRLRGQREEDEESRLSAPLRQQASDPRLVVPLQAVGIAGLIATYSNMIYRPVDPYTLDVLAVNGLLLAVCALLWLRQTRRQRLLGAAEAPRRAGFAIRSLRAAGGLAVVAGAIAATVAVGQATSKLPPSFDMSHGENMDYGGGPEEGLSDPRRNVSVADLTGGADTQGTPDKSFTLTTTKKPFTFSSGKTIEAWTYNGQVPGPVLTVNEGDLVQITLVNQIPDAALTIHWHGINLPNSQDGVPGVTQDAVRTGQKFVYRFRIRQVGTFWYHSHQTAYEQVDRGLFGALVALPKDAQPDPYDIAVTMHDWKLLKSNRKSRTESFMTFDQADGLSKRAVPAGSRVRLRVINTGTNAVNDEKSPTFVLTGTTFRIAATDGTEINQPGELQPGTQIVLGTGGRADLTFTMPDGPVRLTNLENTETGLVFSPDGTATAPAPPDDGPIFDRANYGAPAPTPFNASSKFDREFKMVLDDGPGFYNGQFGILVKINGEVFPNTPMLMVRQGDLAKMKIVGRGHVNHPMHLHGHHMLVLSRNGKPITGSPWWTDSLEVRIGEIYEVAFRADNPGVWMDHCHNLQHGASGMVTHLGYEGVTSPYRAGHGTGNNPEGEKLP